MDISVSVGKVEEPKKVTKKAGEPNVKASAKHGGNKAVAHVDNTKSGMFTLIALDSEGNEKGQEFNVTAKTYNKAFSDTSKFKVKKKAI